MESECILKHRPTIRIPGKIFIRCVIILFMFIPALLPVIYGIPAQAGIVDVSGIEVPPVNGPVCANCNGAGCDQCQPNYGGDDVDPPSNNNPDPDPDPKPDPKPDTKPDPTPPAVQNTVTAPAETPQQVFERRKEALLKEFRMPASLSDDISSLPVLPPSAVIDNSFGSGTVPTGLLDSEWKEASECQRALDVLYAKWPLSNDEIAELNKLETRRNELWAKAVSIPGLTAEERERLRLKLHTYNAQSGISVPTISKDNIDKWLLPPSLPVQGQNKPPVPALNPVSSWLVGQFALGQAQGTIELGGELWADQIIEEHKFGDFLGVGKIALAYKDGGASSALAETCNYLVGKISIPQANIAVEGGRLYANVVYQAQNKFMTDAMKAVGGEFDKEKFWAEFNEDCNFAQKAVKEWIGYGTN